MFAGIGTQNPEFGENFFGFKSSETPRELNEHALREFKKSNFYKKLNTTSYKILKRLKGK